MCDLIEKKSEINYEYDRRKELRNNKGKGD
jgi:hypothetical protein